MTVPSVVTESHGHSSSATPYSLPLPSGIVAGDLLLGILSVPLVSSNWPATITWTGWTAVAGLAEIGVGGGDAEVQVWYRIADGSEGSTTAVSVPLGGSGAAYQIFRITDYTGVPVLAQISGTGSVDPPSLTSGFGAVDTLWFALISGSSTRTVTAYPSGYSSGIDVGPSGPTLSSARKTSGAASEDPGSYTLDIMSGWFVPITIGVEGSVALTGVPASLRVGIIG